MNNENVQIQFINQNVAGCLDLLRQILYELIQILRAIHILYRIHGIGFIQFYFTRILQGYFTGTAEDNHMNTLKPTKQPWQKDGYFFDKFINNRCLKPDTRTVQIKNRIFHVMEYIV